MRGLDITILDAARATPPKGLVARMLDLGERCLILGPAKLNKDMLAQLSVLIALGVASAQDRDAIKAWVEGKVTRQRRAMYDAGALSENQDARLVFDAGERRTAHRTKNARSGRQGRLYELGRGRLGVVLMD